MGGPLKIAVFAYEFPALSETFVLNQITGLIDQGHDVMIFAERPRGEPQVHVEVARYDLDQRTRYLRMPKNLFLRVIAGAGLVLRLIWRCPCQVLRALNVWRHGRVASSLRLLFWVATVRDGGNVDIVHCHFGPMGLLAVHLREIGVLSGRLVTVFHGVDISAQLVDQPDYYRRLFSTGDLFLPISRRWQDKLIELGTDPARTHVHHMGTSLRGIRFRSRYCGPDQPLFVLTVGRLVEKKGIEYGIEAIAQLARHGVDVRYTIIGDGPLQPRIENLIQSLGVEDRVRCLGWQDSRVVMAMMETADILLAPSVTTADGDQEGIPVTLMEAMATGMLVVASRHSGIPELVEHGVSGILVPERDARGIAAAILNLVADAAHWSEMSRVARERITEAFDIDCLNLELVERFRDLIDDPVRHDASENFDIGFKQDVRRYRRSAVLD
ncbi:MAG: glycosyltransferase [Rhodospirillales bacterium]